MRTHRFSEIMSVSSSATLIQYLLLILTVSKFSLSAADDYSHKFSMKSPVGKPSCPLNFDSLLKLVNNEPIRPAFRDMLSQCRYVYEGTLFLRAQYLQTSGAFFPPLDTNQTCWESYRDLISEYFLHGFDIGTACWQHPDGVFNTCKNITSQEQFESLLPASELQEMSLYCSKSLDNDLACKSCTNKLLGLAKQYFSDGPLGGNISSSCSSYLSIYAAGIIGRNHPGTAKCFFGLEYSVQSSTGKRHKPVLAGVVFGCALGVAGSSIVVWLVWLLHVKYDRRKKNHFVVDEVKSSDVELGLSTRSTHLVEFDIEEIRRATMNFSRDNLIGKGGYGNVYKGILPGGSEVAFKRFKNCSASGDATFAHEVQIIASVRHVNLVALRGYAIAKIPLQGHQRIIAYDLMRNGSLHDHLFGSGMKRLSWPVRQRIALGTARGLAYLHNGAHPAIFHRDIKASNILLDENFEPKVADFGLAKFNSHGTTHLSTRVAGTLGYVSPEYALYGKLTEKSDVYSFGVLLLELLTGRKAYENHDGRVSLLADWAWNMVKEGRALDAIEENVPEVGLAQVMELYVHVAVICAHPLLHARPTMDQVVKILESNLPISLCLRDHICACSSGISSITSSCMVSSSSGENDEQRNDEEEMRGSFALGTD